MRKLVSVIMSFALLVSLAACSSQHAKSPEPEVYNFEQAEMSKKSAPSVKVESQANVPDLLSYTAQKEQEVTPALKKVLEEQIIKSRKDVPWEKGSAKDAIYFETRNSVTRMVDFEDYNLSLLNGTTLCFKVDQAKDDVFAVEVTKENGALLSYGKDQPDLTRIDYIIQVPATMPAGATAYNRAEGFYEIKDGDKTSVYYKLKDGTGLKLEAAPLFTTFTAEMLNTKIKPFLDGFSIVKGTDSAIKWFILPEVAVDLTDEEMTGYSFESSGFFKLRVGNQNMTGTFSGIGVAEYKFSNLVVNDVNFKSIKLAERLDIETEKYPVLVSESGTALLRLPCYEIEDLRREIPTYAKLGDIVWAKE